jgi:hypothetical protein
MEGPGKRILSASATNQEFQPRTANPDSTEAEVSLPARKKSSRKVATGVRTLHEPLNPSARITPITPSPATVAPSLARQVEKAEAEAAMDLGSSWRNPSSVAHGAMVNERDLRADHVQREKKAKKDKKTADCRDRDALVATAVSLAYTPDIGTPRDAGTRASVQKTCMDGLMTTGADGQAAVGQGVFTNPGSGERHTKKRKKTAPRNGVLDSLEEASRQRVLSRPTSEPASGRTTGTLARLFEQSETVFVAPVAILSPTEEKFGRRRRRRPAQTGWVRRLAEKHAAASSG